MTPRQTRIAELGERLNALRSEMLDLEAVESPSEEQVVRMDGIVPEYDEAKAEYVRLVEAEAAATRVREAAEVPVNREATAPQVMLKRDPFEGVAVQRGQDGGFRTNLPAADVRARALSAIEATEHIADEFRENATQLVQRNNAAAELALATGSPVYRSAFEKILENPTSFQAHLDREEAEALRTAMSTTVGNGGYAIPFLLDPSVILTGDGSTNPFRQRATIKQGTSNKWNGLSSAGVSAEWKSEGGEAADGSPTFDQPSIQAHLADVFAFGSYEVFQDSDLANDLPMMIAEAKDDLEAAAFAVGSGSGAPYGVVTAVTAVTASRVNPTTAGTFTTASMGDVYKLIEAVPPKHRPVASWAGNFKTFNTIRRMGEAAGAGATFWANLGATQPEQLLGLPVLESSEMTDAATTGSNILLAGNFKRYYIYDRIGMSLEFIPNIVGSSGRPTAQRGWFATWRVGANVVDPNAFRVLKL